MAGPSSGSGGIIDQLFFYYSFLVLISDNDNHHGRLISTFHFVDSNAFIPLEEKFVRIISKFVP